MPDRPEFGSEAWFVEKAKDLPWFRVRDAGALRDTMAPGTIMDPTYCQTPILRDVVAEALEWAADHTGLFITRCRGFKKGSEVIRDKAKEVRRG